MELFIRVVGVHTKLVQRILVLVFTSGIYAIQRQSNSVIVYTRGRATCVKDGNVSG